MNAPDKIEQLLTLTFALTREPLPAAEVAF